jgi:hypothetical protein
MHATEGVNCIHLNGTPPNLNQRDQSLNLNLEPSYYIRHDASPYVSTSGIMYVHAVLFKVCASDCSETPRVIVGHNNISAA